MTRWEPDARGRLQGAALDLYDEHGFEQTTVADIAASVGLTERTFFRHFSDKREVLFDGQEILVTGFLEAMAAVPSGATPLEVVTSAIATGGLALFTEERRDWSRRRQRVIEATPSLAEREHLKMGVLAGELAAGLRQRGVGEPTATLAAESGVLVFRVAFGQWVAEGERRSLVELERGVLAQLGDVAVIPSGA